MSDLTDDELQAREDKIHQELSDLYDRWLPQLGKIDPNSLEVLNHASTLAVQWDSIAGHVDGVPYQIARREAINSLARYLSWELRQKMHALEKAERELAEAQDQLRKIGRRALWASRSPETE